MGTLTSIAPDQIVVRDADGEHVLRLDETRSLRGFQGNRVRGDLPTSISQAAGFPPFHRISLPAHYMNVVLILELKHDLMRLCNGLLPT